MPKLLSPIMALSAVDGRYAGAAAPLCPYLSEFALIRYRVHVEVEYLFMLDWEQKVPMRKITDDEMSYLRRLVSQFSVEDALEIQQIERGGHAKHKATNHDVQAVVLWLQDKMAQMSLVDLVPWVHFALTSEDINSNAQALMLRDALRDVIIPKWREIISQLDSMASTHASTPMLARTHGQPASPTTLGKEIRVFVSRLERQLNELQQRRILAKLAGASGNFNAHMAALPTVNWPYFARTFVEHLSDNMSRPTICVNMHVTQIEPHDTFAEVFQNISRFNTILIDFAVDMWGYISDFWLSQRPVAGEVGSSAMPHKVNPINFENAEGNLGFANAHCEFYARKLPTSRFQRDLSDSTVIRNFGATLGHCLIAYNAILAGLGKIFPNEKVIREALDGHPEVLAEAVQIILRREGVVGAYDILKELARGKDISMEELRVFIDGLPVSDEVKARLYALRPHNYIGLAEELADGRISSYAS